MKFSITVESFGDNKFRITTDDDVATTTITTDSPMKEVVNIMRGYNVRGKKGRKALKKPVTAVSVTAS